MQLVIKHSRVILLKVSILVSSFGFGTHLIQTRKAYKLDNNGRKNIEELKFLKKI